MFAEAKNLVFLNHDLRFWAIVYTKKALKNTAMAKNNRTTIHDIASFLNITASTVSRALNDNPRISKATRKAVLKAANN